MNITWIAVIASELSPLLIFIGFTLEKRTLAYNSKVKGQRDLNFGLQVARDQGSLPAKFEDSRSYRDKTCPNLTDGRTNRRTDEQTNRRTDGRRTKPGNNNSAELKLTAELKIQRQIQLNRIQS